MEGRKIIIIGLIVIISVFAVVSYLDFFEEEIDNGFEMVFHRTAPGAFSDVLNASEAIYFSDVLNTSEGTYTRKYPEEGSFDITLSETEREKITSKMNEIGFLDYPENFSEECEPDLMTSKESNYQITIEHNSEIKKVNYHTGTYEEGNPCKEDYEKLRSLTHKIIDIIESREEYEQLPGSLF